MTAEQFTDQIDKLIVLAREGGLSDEEMARAFEDALDRLDEGIRTSAEADDTP